MYTEMCQKLACELTKISWDESRPGAFFIQAWAIDILDGMVSGNMFYDKWTMIKYVLTGPVLYLLDILVTNSIPKLNTIDKNFD